MAEVRELASGLEFPEGPVALADGSVLVCEIKGKRITRVAADGSKDLIAETGGVNESAVHEDLVCDLRQGGSVTVDGTQLQVDGKFVV